MEHFRLDDALITVDEGFAREKVLCDGRLVSERHTWLPRIAYPHRFTSERRGRSYEVRSYLQSGVLVWEDGRLVAEKPPSRMWPVVFGFITISHGIDVFFGDYGWFDVVMAVVAMTLLSLGLFANHAWRRDRRNKGGPPVETASPETSSW